MSFMKEWKEYIAKDFCSKITDGTHDSPKPQASGHYLITSKHLKDNQIDFSSANLISEEDYQKVIMRSAVEQYDILFSMIGTIGNIVQVKQEVVDFAVKNMGIFKMGRNPLKSTWLYYWLNSDCSKQYINQRLAGSTQSYLTLDSLRNFPISYPGDDKAISTISILKSLDDKIECNRRINENLEQQAQALFKSWFVDFEPFKDLPFVESELGMIPQGWKSGCLDNICCFISRGLTPKYDESSDELILGQTCVRNNIVTLNNARKHKPKTKTEKWVKQWDVLINSTGIGSLGRVGVVYFNMDNVAIDSHMTVVRASAPLYRHFIGRNLLNRQLEIENMAIGSTGQTELPRDMVKAMPIIIPSDEVLEKFNDIIEPMALTMYRNIEDSARLAELRDTLLPKLMSGEINVSEVNI